MLAYLLQGIGVFFLLLVGLGIVINNFILYGIGMTIAGVSFVLLCLVAKTNWAGFDRYLRPFKSENAKRISGWVSRIIYFAIGVLLLVGPSGFWSDLPSYVTGNYKTLEDVPSQIVYSPPEGHSLGGDVTVIINGKRLSLNPVPSTPVDQLKGHYFTIYYLPKTEWIIAYKIN